MKNLDFTNKTLNIIVLCTGILGYWVVCLYLYFHSEAPVDPNDGVYHYQLARYTWDDPKYFLHHWGKPLFNILSSPFAQMGFTGMVVFNLLLFSLCSIMLYRMGRYFNFALAGIGPYLLMTSVVFLQMVNAGMTEILMATLSLAVIYFFVLDKVLIASLLASLAVVTRPEAVIIIPLFGFVLFMSKKWRYIPALFTGFVIFSLWGYLGYGKSILWLIKEDPYPTDSPYGSGGLWHYVDQTDLIFGPAISILAGFALLLFLVTQVRLLPSGKRALALLYSFAATLLILALHSYLWWKGLKGSLGLVRVMATTIPLAVFAVMYGVDFLLKSRVRIIGLILLSVLLVISTQNAIDKSGLPVKMEQRQHIQAKAAEWYNQQNHEGRVCYLAPFFGFKAGLLPQDSSKVSILWDLDREDPAEGLLEGDIIVWDSQFGPIEGRVEEESAIENPRLEVVKYFEDSLQEVGPGEKPYRIYILKKK